MGTAQLLLMLKKRAQGLENDRAKSAMGMPKGMDSYEDSEDPQEDLLD
jgi:hypothetical protein